MGWPAWLGIVVLVLIAFGAGWYIGGTADALNIGQAIDFCESRDQTMCSTGHGEIHCASVCSSDTPGDVFSNPGLDLISSG